MYKRLTKYIAGFAHGLEGISENEAINSGTYCRGEFEATACVERLAAYEDSKLSPEEVQELAKAKADGRMVELPCKVGELMGKYRELTESEGADEAETYTTGYRNGHRNGQTELLAYLLQIDTGCREAAERTMAEVGE